MNSEYSPDLLSLLNDDGVEKEFEILYKSETDDKCFYVLSPYYDDPADSLNRAFEYYIFEASEQDGEQRFVEVEDEAEYNKVLSAFEDYYNGIFSDDE